MTPGNNVYLIWIHTAHTGESKRIKLMKIDQIGKNVKSPSSVLLVKVKYVTGII